MFAKIFAIAVCLFGLASAGALYAGVANYGVYGAGYAPATSYVARVDNNGAWNGYNGAWNGYNGAWNGAWNNGAWNGAWNNGAWNGAWNNGAWNGLRGYGAYNGW